MPRAGNIGVNMSFDSSRFVRGVGSAGSALGGFSLAASAALAAVSGTLNLKFRTVGKSILVLGASIIKGVQASSAFVSELKKAARQAGVTTQQMLRFRHATLFAGQELEDLNELLDSASSLKNFNRFATRMQMDMKGLGELNAGERFESILETIASIEDRSDRFKAAFSLGLDADQVLTLTETAEKFAEAGEQMKRFGVDTSALKDSTKVLGKFRAMFLAVQAVLAQYVSEHDELIDKLFRGFLERLPSLLDKVVGALEIFTKSWKRMLLGLVQFKVLLFSWNLSFISGLIAGLSKLATKTLPKLGASLASVSGTMATFAKVLRRVNIAVTALAFAVPEALRIREKLSTRKELLQQGYTKEEAQKRLQALDERTVPEHRKRLATQVAVSLSDRGEKRLAADFARVASDIFDKVEIPPFFAKLMDRPGTSPQHKGFDEEASLAELKAAADRRKLREEQLRPFAQGNQLDRLKAEREKLQGLLASGGLTGLQQRGLTEGVTGLDKQIADLQPSVDKQLAGLGIGSEEFALTEQLEKLKEFQAGTILSPEHTEAVNEKIADLKAKLDEVKTPLTSMKRIGKQFAGVLVNQIGDGISAMVSGLVTGQQRFRDLGKAAKDFGKQILSTIVSALAKALAMALAIKAVLGFMDPGSTFAGFKKGAGFGSIFKGSLSKAIGFQEGGTVGKDWNRPGSQDLIPAMLARGERVVPRRAVARIGKPAMDEIQKGRLPMGSGTTMNVNLSINPGWVSNPEELGEIVVEQLEGNLRARLLDTVIEATTSRSHADTGLREMSHA